MKEKPILFSGPMVQAILGERKTQTRRVIKPQPYTGCWYEGTVDEYHQFYESRGGNIGHYLCPYGEPGDVGWNVGLPPAGGLYYVKGFSEDRPVWLRRYKAGLLWGYDEHDDPEAIEIEGLTSDTIEWKRPGDTLWVRETWRTCREDDSLKPSELDPENAGDLWWEADGSSRRRLNAKPGKVRPSIFMPRWASRITLRVKSVRVERVQEISAVGAMWEGIALAHNPINKLTIEALGDRSSTGLAVIEDFIALWDSINAKRGFGWHVNPFVWVVEFEKVEVGE